eukprot:TRINITY_DN82362_c0_g1_i1.p1 TRINITY_DN82362_c0_g1~~TRINITY_DN82362_c0_g1_i1.p1  ORF type:complete len:619 (-),score=83.22 TRINITY_DN82362_c0_g1_i1:396-2252(-)
MPNSGSFDPFAFRCEASADGRGQTAADNPFRSLACAGLGHRLDRPAVLSLLTTREIAEQLKVLQECFVEAHERQVTDLQRLLNATELTIPEDKPSPAPAYYQLVEEGVSLAAGTDVSDKWSLLDEQEVKQTVEENRETHCASAEPCVENSSASGENCEQPTECAARSQDVSKVNSVGCQDDSNCIKAGQAVPSTARKTLSLKMARGDTGDSSINEVITSIDGRASFFSNNTGSMLLRCTESLHRLTISVHFELFCGVVIVLNAIFMAVETQHKLTAPLDESEPRWLVAVGRQFTAFFVLELALRICCGVRRFFCTCNAWNYFDSFIVVCSIVEYLVEKTASLSNTRLVRVVRVTRMVKVLRMARIIKIVGGLRKLLNSLIGTMKQVVWSFFLIFCLIFVAAIIAGQMVGQARQADALDEEARALLYWGSMWRCMYTLYSSVSGGISWAEAAQPLQELGGAAFYAFVLYVGLVQWVVLNVITACFCESAAETARRDMSLSIQAHRSDRDHFLQRCKSIFKAIDQDGSGMLSISEMRSFLDSETALSLFAALQLDIMDVHDMFQLLDQDGSALIDLDEFAFGCLRLRGDAKALDIARILTETQRISGMMREVLDAQHKKP